MDTSSSSKVTVEYHDPSGIFPLISSDLTACSPLRNLSWRSAFRPPRQIKSIHLDFVPDESTKASLRPTSPPLASDGATSVEIISNGSSQHKDANVKERRHQIPGLQTSPYLRVYILRCDDKDTYKETEREKLRAWIRENAAVSAHSSSKTKTLSANHDAFEWLILHVVVPDTIAASEPRWRESTREPDELKERKQGVKWPGKSTRTVFDKLRADFNESSKGTQDRVAQIRLLKTRVPPDLLPTPAIATTYDETADESSKTWNDVTNKLKTLILDSFDRRVRQYETDVAEQEARRSMPGFNFCTFFIHKEGLAKALESIGLTEDALVIYDELALGLETVLHDIAEKGSENIATAFASFTHDIEYRITANTKSNVTNGNTLAHGKEDLKELDPQDYREKIVRNTISVFDFNSYVFSRQKTLILRIANARSARVEYEPQTKEPAEDLVMISEVCWRGTIFVHNNARVLQQDLSTRRGHTGNDQILRDHDIEALVASWVYDFVARLLRDTHSPAVEYLTDHNRREDHADGATPNPRRSEFQSLGGANVYPLRTTSLPPRQSRLQEVRQDRKALHSHSEEMLPSSPSTSNTDAGGGTTVSSGSLSGLPELATYRADLLMMQRKMLDLCARQRGWVAGWASLRDGQEGATFDSDLTSERSSITKSRFEAGSEMLGAAIAKALESGTTFFTTYTDLSETAMRLYISSTQTKSAEAIMGDLAITKSQQGDYEYAANYFQYVLPLYKEQCWSLMESRAAHMLAQCLRALERTAEYVVVLLGLVSSAVAEKRKRPGTTVQELGQFDPACLLRAAAESSKGLNDKITFPAQYVFENVELDATINHQTGTDGFFLRLKIRNNLRQVITIDEASAYLVGLDYTEQELCLKSPASVQLTHGSNEVNLESDYVTVGPYFVKKIVLKMKNLSFVHSVSPEESTAQHLLALGSDTDRSAFAGPETHLRQRVYIYPPEHTFDADIRLAKEIYIDRSRHLEIHLRSGWNEVETVELRLKPASAGLRLHLADARCLGIEERAPDTSPEPGCLYMGRIGERDSATVTVPYSLEHASTEIVVHLFVRYAIAPGKFHNFMTSARLPTRLPLDVDVNDIFHQDAVYSTFSVRTTGPSPLKITNAALRSSAIYEVETPPTDVSTLIQESVPAKLIYKTTLRERHNKPVTKQDVALALSVRYRAVDELIINTICSKFDGDLAQTGLSAFRRMLLPYFRMRQLVRLDYDKVRIAAVSGHAIVLTYDDVGWDELVSTLPFTLREKTLAWLRSWHEVHPSVALPDGQAGQTSDRSIVISVDVPTIDFVHTTSLTLTPTSREGPHRGPQILELGRRVKATVHLTSTQAWSGPSIVDSSSNVRDGHNAFTVEVNADHDKWLVGGKRRVHVLAPQAGEELSWEVALLPLKAGLHTLPVVEVQPVRMGGVEQEQKAVTCETQCASAGQAVRVVREQRRARVVIPESILHASTQMTAADVNASPRPSIATTVTTTEPA